MKTSQHFQKISTGLSLVTLASGFWMIGLMSLTHQTLSGDPISSAVSCEIGGWASMATAGVFLFTALIYCRRHFSISFRLPARARKLGAQPDADFSA